MNELTLSAPLQMELEQPVKHVRPRAVSSHARRMVGDDVETTIRPRRQRFKRGPLRVIQAAAVERPEDFEPVRIGRGDRPSMPADGETTRTSASGESPRTAVRATATTSRDDRQLLDMHAVEKMSSLDITTIYRKMSASTFPQPVTVGRRRVAWRTSDVVRWQQDLEVGTETARQKASRTGGGNPSPGGGGRRGRR